jgi:hypothetical protein
MTLRYPIFGRPPSLFHIAGVGNGRGASDIYRMMLQEMGRRWISWVVDRAELKIPLSLGGDRAPS